MDIANKCCSTSKPFHHSNKQPDPKGVYRRINVIYLTAIFFPFFLSITLFQSCSKTCSRIQSGHRLIAMPSY
jgi:hypothetical protein